MKQSESAVSHELIKSQVELICSSRYFVNAEKLCGILHYLVNETLEGRGDAIKAYSIGVDALARRSDFDPSTDSIVRAQIHRLRTKLKSYYAQEGKDSSVLIQIPINGYKPKFLLQEAQKKNLVSFGSAVSWRPSIIVPPFVNQTPESGYSYFSDGLPESLSVALSKFQDIDVLGYYSENAYNQRLVAGIQVYPARFTLSGRYKALGDQLRLQITLTDNQQAKILWAEAMDFKLVSGNWFALEDKIVSNVLSFIAGDHGLIAQHMLRESRDKNLQTLEIYEAVLRYYSFTCNPTLQMYDEAIFALEKCLERYKSCPALVYAALAELYVSDYKLVIDAVPDALHKAEVLIDKAFQLDHNLQAAHLAMANLCFTRRNKVELDMYIDNVIQVNPNNYSAVSIALDWYARSGDLESGCARLRALYEKISEILPYHHYTPFLLYHFKRGEYRQALQYCYHPGHADFHDIMDYYAAIIHSKLGNISAVQQNIERIRRHPIKRRGKLDRMLCCVTFYDDLNAEFLEILRTYGLD